MSFDNFYINTLGVDSLSILYTSAPSPLHTSTPLHATPRLPIHTLHLRLRLCTPLHLFTLHLDSLSILSTPRLLIHTLYTSTPYPYSTPLRFSTLHLQNASNCCNCLSSWCCSRFCGLSEKIPSRNPSWSPSSLYPTRWFYLDVNKTRNTFLRFCRWWTFARFGVSLFREKASVV